jgi:hypothetical protein
VIKESDYESDDVSYESSVTTVNTGKKRGRDRRSQIDGHWVYEVAGKILSHHEQETEALGARTKIPSGHMVNTL